MRLPLWRRRQDDDLSEEIRTHLDMAVRDYMDRGLSPADAEAAVRRQFGNQMRVTEATRATWGWVWLEQLAQDLRCGVRMLLKAPGFTLAALATLALSVARMVLAQEGRLALVALAACYLPARRATRVDPMVALRHE